MSFDVKGVRGLLYQRYQRSFFTKGARNLSFFVFFLQTGQNNGHIFGWKCPENDKRTAHYLLIIILISVFYLHDKSEYFRINLKRRMAERVEVCCQWALRDVQITTLLFCSLIIIRIIMKISIARYPQLDLGHTALAKRYGQNNKAPQIKRRTHTQKHP